MKSLEKVSMFPQNPKALLQEYLTEHEKIENLKYVCRYVGYMYSFFSWMNSENSP